MRKGKVSLLCRKLQIELLVSKENVSLIVFGVWDLDRTISV